VPFTVTHFGQQMDRAYSTTFWVMHTIVVAKFCTGSWVSDCWNRRKIVDT